MGSGLVCSMGHTVCGSSWRKSLSMFYEAPFLLLVSQFWINCSGKLMGGFNHWNLLNSVRLLNQELLEGRDYVLRIQWPAKCLADGGNSVKHLVSELMHQCKISQGGPSCGSSHICWVRTGLCDKGRAKEGRKGPSLRHFRDQWFSRWGRRHTGECAFCYPLTSHFCLSTTHQWISHLSKFSLPWS